MTGRAIARFSRPHGVAIYRLIIKDAHYYEAEDKLQQNTLLKITAKSHGSHTNLSFTYRRRRHVATASYKQHSKTCSKCYRFTPLSGEATPAGGDGTAMIDEIITFCFPPIRARRGVKAIQFFAINASSLSVGHILASLARRRCH